VKKESGKTHHSGNNNNNNNKIPQQEQIPQPKKLILFMKKCRLLD
jgi:hypothetical protein